MNGSHPRTEFPAFQVEFGMVSDSGINRSDEAFSIFIGDKPGGKGWGVGLKGKEAQEALAVFQTLHREIIEWSK